MRTGGGERDGGPAPLRDVRVLTLAVNLPGPAAASRLCAMGASVIKVEPPGGDPLARMCPCYYEDLSAGQEVVRLDLKDQRDRASLDGWLRGTDLLLTASRPAALGRLGLSWPELHAGFPHLCQVAIVGHPPPEEDAPGHDLTYQARFGTLSPPEMPPVLVADLAGAEQAVSVGPLAAVRQRAGTRRGVRAGVPLGGGAVSCRAVAPGAHGARRYPGGRLSRLRVVSGEGGTLGAGCPRTALLGAVVAGARGERRPPGPGADLRNEDRRAVGGVGDGTRSSARCGEAPGP